MTRPGSAFQRSRPSSASNKRILDIEDALIWAYRDELPKSQLRESGGDFSTISPMFRMAAFGGPIDNWNREPGYPAAMGDPHPDAVIISDHVEALARKSLPAVDDPGLMADMEGMPVDRVAALQRALPVMSALVVINAKLRRRPPWSERPEPRQPYSANGKVRVMRVEPIYTQDAFGAEVVHYKAVPCTAERKNSYPEGAYCPLLWDPDPAGIVLERAEYVAWHNALEILAGELAGSLTSIGVLPPSAPKYPWLGDRELGKPKQLFQGTREPVRIYEKRETITARRALGRRRAGPVRIVPVPRRTSGSIDSDKILRAAEKR